jgi:HlyD family secretion protein
MRKNSVLATLRWQHLLAALVLAVLVLLAWRWWQGPQVAVESVLQRDFVQTVVASGHVQSPNRVDIGSQITATVARVPVQEGDSVKAGALLVELGSADLLAAQRQAAMALVQAQGKLRQLQELQAPVAEQTLRQARSSLDNANASYRRSQDLFQQGFIGQAALDDGRKAAELADAQARSAQMQRDSSRQGGSDHALAEAAVAEARAAADAARARAQYALIRAPADGVLIARNVEVGDVVQAGKLLMTLSPHGKTQIVVAIDEKNLHLIALGQKALVSADAYAQQKFTAVLAYINPGVNVQTGAVDVKLDVAEPPAVLRQDMTVSVDIEVARRPQALLLSAAALRDADTAAPWVLRVHDGRTEKVTVQTGLRSGGQVDVLRGLQAGEQVLTGASTLHGGERVRAQSTAP